MWTVVHKRSCWIWKTDVSFGFCYLLFKQKDILRNDIPRIFLSKHNDAKNIKFNESVFWLRYIIILSYEKPSWKKVVIMSILFSNLIKIFLRIHHHYSSEKSDCLFCVWSNVTLQKIESFGVLQTGEREEGL